MKNTLTQTNIVCSLGNQLIFYKNKTPEIGGFMFS